MIQRWLGAIPAIIYSFIAGSLLDKFGCKPFLIFPCFGLFICSICAMINYAFIEDLPVEFFFLDCLFNFFGGNKVNMTLDLILNKQFILMKLHILQVFQYIFLVTTVMELLQLIQKIDQKL